MTNARLTQNSNGKKPILSDFWVHVIRLFAISTSTLSIVLFALSGRLCLDMVHSILFGFIVSYVATVSSLTFSYVQIRTKCSGYRYYLCALGAVISSPFLLVLVMRLWVSRNDSLGSIIAIGIITIILIPVASILALALFKAHIRFFRSQED